MPRQTAFRRLRPSWQREQSITRNGDQRTKKPATSYWRWVVCRPPSISSDVIVCGWLGSKNQLTNWNYPPPPPVGPLALLLAIVQENASQKEERYWADGFCLRISCLRKEVEVAIQSLKKGKSAGVDNIPAELVQASGENVIPALATICNKLWQTGEWPHCGPSP